MLSDGCLEGRLTSAVGFVLIEICSPLLIEVTEAKKPRQTQNPVDEVQVKATPVNNRFRDALTTGFQVSGPQFAHYVSEPEFIPSSGQERGATQISTSPRVACTPQTDRIHATPVRASAVPGRLL